MRLLLTCCLLLLSIFLFAQKEDTHIIHKDTINLRGFIYNADGKPAKDKFIQSKQSDLNYNRFPIYAQTDSNGYFMLKGAKPNDTLTIREITGPLFFYNTGSRFMIIYLPAEKTNDLNSQSPVMIEAKRKYPKLTPGFKIIEYPGGEGGIERMPEPPGGTKSFFNYLSKVIKYPEKAVTINVEGTVEVGFTISRDGSITDVKLLKGIGYGCDEQVLDAVKKSYRWRPGIFEGRPVVLKESVSVKFSLTDK
jgi:TonB family protein